MKIELVRHKDKVNPEVTIEDVTAALNNHLPDSDMKFFSSDGSRSIYFEDCANMDEHNKLLALVTLYLCSLNEFDMGSFQSLGSNDRRVAGYFYIYEEIFPDLLKFIKSIDLTKEVQITY